MKSIATISALSLLLAVASYAQMGPPTPAPETKKLDIFAGSWTLEGDMKPGPMGPGGNMMEREKCEWMEGNFFLICRSDFKTATMGNGTGLSVMSYSRENKAYSYREFNSWGENMESKGSVEGDTWTWANEEKMGDMPMKGRFVMKWTSPTSYNFSYEISEDGTKWTSVMDGKATKQK